MPEVVVVRGSGGVLYEMDVPTRGHALELWEEKLRKGDLVIVTDPVEWVEVGDGARQLRLATSSAEGAVLPQERRKPGRPPKVRGDADSPSEGSDSNEE
jgi:hypothetical protein